MDQQLEKTKPELIAIQIDPMHYLANQRNFALDVVPHIKEDYDMERMGVFGDNYKLPNEEEETDNEEKEMKNEKYKRFSKKIHSLYFPMSWNEAIVNPERLLMIANRITSIEDAEIK